MRTLFQSALPASLFPSRAFGAALVAGALLLSPQLVRAQDADAVIAKVDGVEIRQKDVTLATEMLGPALSQMDEAERQKNVIQFLIDMKLAGKTDAAKKYADDDDFKRRLTFAREKLLMDKFLEAAAAAGKTDAAMRKVYEDATKQMSSDTEVHARHILVETEDEAKAIVAELNKGADFAELAKKKSKDPGASDGGDLGFFTKDQMVKEFSDAAFALDKGKISAPVKSQFGWHVIRVEDKRNRQAPSFEQVKDQLETYLTRRAQVEAVTKLREGAKIERLDRPAAEKPAAAPEPKKN